MKKLLLLSFLSLLLGAGTAMADIVPVGLPTSGFSWGQNFSFDRSFSFDLVAVQMITNDLFEGPVFRALSTPGWINVSGPGADVNNGYAFGPATQSLDFRIEFPGSWFDHFAFVFAAFEVGHEGPAVFKLLEFNGLCGWDIRDVTAADNVAWSPQRSDFSVPEPGVLTLLLCGICVLGAGYRRWR